MLSQNRPNNTRRGPGYAHTVQKHGPRLTDIRIYVTKHALGRNKRHREHADRLLKVSYITLTMTFCV